MNFNKIELAIINTWNKTNIKEMIKALRQNNVKFMFLDGPPFVNGTPHHGHLLVSSIKDTVARRKSQEGYMTSYQIGFDCHGVPMEQQAEKIVGKVSPNDSIEKLSKFNDTCRDIISNCSEIWYESLGRLGRMFDKDMTYMTCDLSFMQSLWWAFGKLYNDNLIYRSKKVMPYSPKCETPFSNFEASSNYIDKTDTSVYVKFNINNTNESLLIWTTTPWSLFANQGICVNPELEYSLVCINTDNLWIATDCIEKFCVGEFSAFTVIKTVKGIELVGLMYTPVFDTTLHLNNGSCFKVYADNYVDSKSGTGLVHLAPLFGEDDMRVMKKNGYTDLQLPEFLVDSMVNFTSSIIVNNFDIKGKFVMDDDVVKNIVIHLKVNKFALKSAKITHSYPHCYRTDFPLVYLATDAWFMDIQKIKAELIENNKKIEWFPAHVGTERFANWIENSPDWCLSRNRVWGTPIPIWTNNMGDSICISTVEQLQQLTGRKFDDLHLDKIGDVTFSINGSVYKRTFGVLDCWFESGMAGLAKEGYPNCTTASYPVDFIAESVDQTRGWFYTLNVLSTALNHTNAFKKVIVSGLILAEDGKKMSKRLGNYTSPNAIIDKYGADVFRMYLIGSPAAKAESFCFKDSDLEIITRRLLPYYHAHMILNEYYTYAKTMSNINITDFSYDKLTNTLDKWIVCKFMELGKNINKNFIKMDLTSMPNLIFKFIDNLCNVYIKLSRDRMRFNNTEEECVNSLSTLYYILKNCCHLYAPFMPHLSENFNMTLHNMTTTDDYVSVHLPILKDFFLMIDNFVIDKNIIDEFYSINELLESVRTLRQSNNKPLYYPLYSIDLYTDNTIMEFSDVICRELNVKKINIYPTDTIKRTYKANRALLGKIYKKDMNKYINMIESGNIDFEECKPEYYNVDYVVSDYDNMVGCKFTYIDMNGMNKIAIVYLNLTTDTNTDNEAEVNNIRRQINDIRKVMGLKIFNKIEIVFENNDYWSNINMELFNMLTKRLNTPIKFSNMIENVHTIETFNGKQLNVQINLL